MSASLVNSEASASVKKRGAAIDYEQINEFPDEKAFEAWFKYEKQKWKVENLKNQKRHVDTYLCQFAKKKIYNCPMKLRVVWAQNSRKVFVEQSKGRHQDKEVGQANLSEGDKKIMRDNVGLTPLHLQKKIQSTRVGIRALPPPSIKQIKNFVYHEKNGKGILSVEDLEQYANENSAVPECGDKTFVVKFNLEAKLRPNLMKPFRKEICADVAEMHNEYRDCGFNTWERYQELIKSIHVIRPSAIWRGYYSCNCSAGAKKRHCRHTIMLMCSQGLLVYPPDAKEMPLQRKRKQGRPKKLSQALSRD